MANKRNKIQVDISLDYELDWLYEVEISKIKNDILNLEKLGATHISFDSFINNDSEYVMIEAICRRIEDDVEYKHQQKKKTTNNK